MTTRLQLNHWDDWLLPGSPSDSRLLHADVSDQILVCPSHLGQGYFQDIQLRDDLNLVIFDYTLNQDVVIDAPNASDCLEFAFHLASPEAGYSFFCPYFGLKHFGVKTARKRFFKVEVWCKRPVLVTYFQAFMERMRPQTLSIAERIVQSLCRYQNGRSISASAGLLNRILQRTIVAADSNSTFEQLLPNSLYSEAIALKYETRHPITPKMNQVIGQILSCPYQGATRRTYLEHKALKLIALRLEAMVQPRLSAADLHAIDQAASILRTQIFTPPAIETLARQVGTNRLKLNQGFHQVYDTTPFGYLRDCRLWQAQRLLMTSDQSIGKVSAAVGYTCRSKFATAFRQQMGINPKAFQMQVWQWAS
ncbi:MAG: AraC family transcriptional regulator [Cyanobacteria bacterium J06635_15]